MIFALLTICIVALAAFEQRPIFPSPTLSDMEQARAAKMLDIYFRRVDQDKARKKSEEAHAKLRRPVHATTLHLQISTMRLQRCMEARGL